MSITKVDNQSVNSNFKVINQPLSTEVEFKEQLSQAESIYNENGDIRGNLSSYETIDKYTYNTNNTQSDISTTAMKAKIEWVMQYQQAQQIEAKNQSSQMLELSNTTGLKIEELYNIMQNKLVDATKIEPKNHNNKVYNPLTQKKDGDNVISIKDDMTNEDIYITLDQNNLEALQKQFGDINSDEAKKFVKSWYNEAVYSVGFLSADADLDGRVSMGEAKELNMMLKVDKSGNLIEKTNLKEMFANDSKKIDEFIMKNGYVDDLNQFINMSISDDKNFDGQLSFKEIAKEQTIEFIKQANTLQKAQEKPTNKVEATTINISNVKNNNYFLVDEVLKDMTTEETTQA